MYLTSVSWVPLIVSTHSDAGSASGSNFGHWWSPPEPPEFINGRSCWFLVLSSSSSNLTSPVPLSQTTVPISVNSYRHSLSSSAGTNGTSSLPGWPRFTLSVAFFHHSSSLVSLVYVILTFGSPLSNNVHIFGSEVLSGTNPGQFAVPPPFGSWAGFGNPISFSLSLSFSLNQTLPAGSTLSVPQPGMSHLKSSPSFWDFGIAISLPSPSHSTVISSPLLQVNIPVILSRATLNFFSSLPKIIIHIFFSIKCCLNSWPTGSVVTGGVVVSISHFSISTSSPFRFTKYILLLSLSNLISAPSSYLMVQTFPTFDISGFESGFVDNGGSNSCLAWTGLTHSTTPLGFHNILTSAVIWHRKFWCVSSQQLNGGRFVVS